MVLWSIAMLMTTLLSRFFLSGMRGGVVLSSNGRCIFCILDHITDDAKVDCCLLSPLTVIESPLIDPSEKGKWWGDHGIMRNEWTFSLSIDGDV